MLIHSSGSLSHFGVRGMKWGVRKAHPSFTTEQQHDARDRFGKRGAKRINKRLKRGKTHEQAVKSERRRQIASRIAITLWAALVIRNVATVWGPIPIHSAFAKKWASEGAKHAGDVLSSHALTSYKTVNLAMNAATGVWE